MKPRLRRILKGLLRRSRFLNFLGLWRLLWLAAKLFHRLGWNSLAERACAAVMILQPEFWFAREFPKQMRGFYAQSGQDEVIEGYFRSHPPRCRFFVEVGAFDGVHYSNVRRLAERHGWAGISIEPVRSNFKKLQRSYRGFPVRCVHGAIGPVTGEADIHVSSYPHLPEWGSDVATFVESEKDRWKSYAPRWRKERVPVWNLTQLLEEQGVKDVDLISIDTEGFNLAVLQSLDFSRFAPQMLVVEYGQDRAAILAFLKSQGNALFLDNGQDLFMEKGGQSMVLREPGQPREVTAAEAASKLNPTLVPLLARPCRLRYLTLDPRSLLSERRFDLMAKYIYAKHRHLRIQSDWGRQLYAAHLQAFNEFVEGDSSGKIGLSAFLQAFDQILDSVRQEGAREDLSWVPIDRDNVVIDGSHRVAACLLYDRDVPCLSVDMKYQNFDYAIFGRRGLQTKWSDAMALEYCRLREDSFLAIVFPSASGRDEEIEEILREYCRIYYRKDIPLKNEGPVLLIRLIYASEKWLGGWENSFAGARSKMEACFQKEGPLRIFVLQSDQPGRLREMKERVRHLFGIGNDAVHVNDTHEGTLRLARALLNENSIHFFNSARPQHHPTFERLFTMYKEWLGRIGADSERFCLDSSAILAVYGIRDVHDLDFLQSGYEGVRSGTPDISSHNEEMHNHVTGLDDILFNPENHFYYDGMKFASLRIVREMKRKRGGLKDLEDVRQMDRFLGTGTKTFLPPARISAVVVVCNEERWLPRCLASLVFCDEIVVVDLESRDASARIASQFGAKVIRHARVPVVEQVRQFALAQIKNDWVLLLDPDEAIPPGLAAQLQEAARRNPMAAAVEAPWRFFFKGQPLDHSVWGGKDKWKRILIRRGIVRLHPYVHRGMEVPGQEAVIRITPTEENFIRHDWMDSYRQLFQKHWRYIAQEGEARYETGERFSWGAMALETARGIKSNLLHHRGLWGGAQGIFLSFFYGWYVAMSWLSLRRYELRRKAS